MNEFMEKTYTTGIENRKRCWISLLDISRNMAIVRQ